MDKDRQEAREQRRKSDSTRTSSQAAPHPSTNQALRRQAGSLRRDWRVRVDIRSNCRDARGVRKDEYSCMNTHGWKDRPTRTCIVRPRKQNARGPAEAVSVL